MTDDAARRVSAVDILLRNGADAGVAIRDGRSPLRVAADAGMTSVVERLLQGGRNAAGVSTTAGAVLLSACGQRSRKRVRMLMSYASPDASPSALVPSDDRTSAWQQPAFHVAVEQNDLEMVELLLDNGASVNACDSTGDSPLHICVGEIISSLLSQKHDRAWAANDVLLTLITSGGDVNQLNGRGTSLLNSVVEAYVSDGWRLTDYVRGRLADLISLLVESGAAKLDDSAENLGNLTTSVDHRCVLGNVLFMRDDSFDIVLDLFRAEAGITLLSICGRAPTRSRCRPAARSDSIARNLRLCKSLVLAGYQIRESEIEELRSLSDSMGTARMLSGWLERELQSRQPASLMKLCRVVVRRKLLEESENSSIVSDVDDFPLPDDIREYLKFDGPLTEYRLRLQETSNTDDDDNKAEMEQQEVEEEV